ncbi:MAG: permease prefix domain 1-containing protein [Oscillospiraceae bacterium]|jgi:hypothetical protein|nr:permease prefix domain 1-containing protein [Oscillospiraceae bacterium]
MKEKVYVDRLFEGYEDTPEIKDFKEEITVNLTERIRELVSKGLNDEQAFDRATAELGDITAIADEVGKKNRHATIAQMYMNAKVPITKKAAGGFSFASGLLLIAVGIALFSFFREIGDTAPYYISVILLSIASGLYTYFGLTQETTAHYAMKNKRAFVYSIICMMGFLGAGFSVVFFLFTDMDIAAAIGIKAIFIIPAICILIFLVATEPKRQKPWLKAMEINEYENVVKFHTSMVNPTNAARFGLISGGIFLLTVAVFVAIGVLVAWKYAWIILPLYFALQTVLTMTIFNKTKK